MEVSLWIPLSAESQVTSWASAGEEILGEEMAVGTQEMVVVSTVSWASAHSMAGWTPLSWGPVHPWTIPRRKERNPSVSGRKARAVSLRGKPGQRRTRAQPCPPGAPDPLRGRGMGSKEA